MLAITDLSVDDWVKIGSGIAAAALAWYGWKNGERARARAPVSEAQTLADAMDRLARTIEKGNAADAIERLARVTEAAYATQREEDQFDRLSEKLRRLAPPTKPRYRPRR